MTTRGTYQHVPAILLPIGFGDLRHDVRDDRIAVSYDVSRKPNALCQEARSPIPTEVALQVPVQVVVCQTDNKLHSNVQYSDCSS
jgi:hypothetical protein